MALREGAQGIAFALNADLVKAVVGQRLAALGVEPPFAVSTASVGQNVSSTN